MLDRPRCAACDALAFETVETKRYRRADTERLSPYLKRKYQLLFGTWFQGRDEAEIQVELCTRCGFVGFAPRPEEVDVTAKYEMSLGMGSHDRHTEPGNRQDQRRSERLYQELAPAPGSRVLDYGGGDGRLMQRFAEGGNRCFVVDFIPTPVPGVTRLGSTLSDLDADARFDVIVLSHVLEHVAEPCKLLEQLSRRLDDGGMLFVEVPMELFRQVPPRHEPLTHINFFQPESLRVVMERAGLSVERSKLGWHYTKAQLVCRALGRRASLGRTATSPEGAALSRALLRGDPAPLLRAVAAEPRRSAEVGLSWLERRARSALGKR